MSSEFSYKQLRRLKKGDFVYPKLMAWEGAFAAIPEKFDGKVVSPEFVVFRPNETTLLVEVLDTYFRSPYCLEQVRSFSTGSNQRRRRLNPKAFLQLQIPIPPMDRQRVLREVCELERKILAEHKTRTKQLTPLRDDILRKAFAGEL